jgi:hypothetical protein
MDQSLETMIVTGPCLNRGSFDQKRALGSLDFPGRLYQKWAGIDQNKTEDICQNKRGIRTADALFTVRLLG